MVRATSGGSDGPVTGPRDSSGSYQSSGGSLGRDVRLFVGAVLVLIDLLLIYFEHVSAKPPAIYSMADVVMHLGLLIGGLMLMDTRRLVEVLGVLKDKLPIVGGK